MTPPEDVRKFGGIIWECLSILQEHYPSHLVTSKENMSRCAPYYMSGTSSEELRRMMSCVIARRTERRMMQSDEMEDLFFVLESCVKVKDIRGVMNILEVLYDTRLCPAYCFKNLPDEAIELLRGIFEQDESWSGVQYPGIIDKCKELSQAILYKASSKQSDTAPPAKSKDLKYSVPNSIQAILFQLSETSSVDRLTLLLETINSSCSVDELLANNWTERLYLILDKYCNGVYGADEQETIRYGKLQYQLGHALIRMSYDPVLFLGMLDKGVFTKFFEIVEEACLLYYHITVNKEIPEDNSLIEFIKYGLSLAELCVSPAFYKYLRSIQESLVKVRYRLMSLVDKNEDIEMPSPEDHEALKLLSPALYSCKDRVQLLITKIEALLEYQEKHEEKWQRLFSNVK